MKNKLCFFFLFIFGTSLFGQTEVKVMSYNVLTYPEGSIVNRIDTLSKILTYYQPDLLLLQELKSEEGLQNIVDELNDLFGGYASGTYVSQISNPANSWRLQQNIVFNEAVFELVGEETIITIYRDINYFKLRLIAHTGNAATEFLHVYVTHLKSSTGSTNEQLRLAMAEVLRDHKTGLPAGSQIIAAGDFNVYAGSEPAYQTLISPFGINGLNDPIDMPGWATFNFSNKEILTQSTRLSSLSDGSGGGVDDRFDFILLSDALMNPASAVAYQEGSYLALGNNGTCYNQDLIDCSTIDNVPFDILRALYYMSDHVPIVLTLNVEESVSTIAVDQTKKILKLAPNPSHSFTELSWSGNLPAKLQVLSLQGQNILEKNMEEKKIRLTTNQFASGMYFLKVTDRKGSSSIEKLIVK